MFPYSKISRVPYSQPGDSIQSDHPVAQLMRDRIHSALAGNSLSALSTNVGATDDLSDEAYAMQQLGLPEYREALEECVRFPIRVQRFLSLISEKDERLYNVEHRMRGLRGRSYRATESSSLITSCSWSRHRGRGVRDVGSV